MTVEARTLCVVGAGTMGTGIAQVAALAGLRVHLIDLTADALTASAARLEASLQEGLSREKVTPAQAAEIRQRVTWHGDLSPLEAADWTIEAVFEDMQVKQQVLSQVGALMRAETPIATNTSTFRITDLARGCRRPGRFIGLHFFNPPPAMKLVEVIPGEQTRPAITEAAVAFCERLGKTPVVGPDIPGFLVNRAFAALVAAAIELWATGADPPAIDRALELGLGHKMGPLRTADLVGLDVVLAMLRSLVEQTGHPRFEPPAEFVALVAGGALGRKSGRGFYEYHG
jgi:3-hydroxybutyryl-CoA dehydrogenase